MKNPPSESLTHRWIADNWQRVYPDLHAYLSFKFPLSKRMNLIDHHLSTFALFLLEKQSLDSYLEEGKEIRTCVLKRWAWGKAINEIKKWGKDACLRESRAATTVANRQGFIPKELVQSPSVHVKVVTCGSPFIDEGYEGWRTSTQFDDEHGWAQLVSPNRRATQTLIETSLDPEEHLTVVDFLSKYEEILETLPQPTPDHGSKFLWQVFEATMLGHTIKEIAEDLDEREWRIKSTVRYVKEMMPTV